MSVCLSFSVSVCLSVFLCLYLPVCLSFSQSFSAFRAVSVFLSISAAQFDSLCLCNCIDPLSVSLRLFVFLLLCLSVCLSVCLYVRVSASLPVSLLVYFYICLLISLFVCLLVYLSLFFLSLSNWFSPSIWEYSFYRKLTKMKLGWIMVNRFHSKHQLTHTCALYYKHITIVKDASRVMLKIWLSEMIFQ